MQTTTRRPGRSAVALALSALVLTACGDVPAEEPASPDSQEPVTSGSQVDATSMTEAPDDAEDTTTATGAVPLEQDSIGGVSLPADPDTVLGELTTVLGEPTQDEELQGCTGADGGVLRTIAWDGLRVSGMAEDEDSVQLTSWQVREGAPEQVTLPHGLVIGATEDEAIAALPGAELFADGMPHGGSMILRDELRVLLDGADDLVLEVNGHTGSTSCD